MYFKNVNTQLLVEWEESVKWKIENDSFIKSSEFHSPSKVSGVLGPRWGSAMRTCMTMNETDI
jgi:hypothetical protein